MSILPRDKSASPPPFPTCYTGDLALRLSLCLKVNMSQLCVSSLQSPLANIPQADVKLEFDDPTTREQIEKVTMQMKVGKSPGIDGIPAEVYQYGGEAALDELQDLFTNCWEKGTLPQDLPTVLKGSPFEAWSRSAYSHTCYNYCQEFLPC